MKDRKNNKSRNNKYFFYCRSFGGCNLSLESEMTDIMLIKIIFVIRNIILT